MMQLHTSVSPSGIPKMYDRENFITIVKPGKAPRQSPLQKSHNPKHNASWWRELSADHALNTFRQSPRQALPSSALPCLSVEAVLNNRILQTLYIFFSVWATGNLKTILDRKERLLPQGVTFDSSIFNAHINDKRLGGLLSYCRFPGGGNWTESKSHIIVSHSKRRTFSFFRTGPSPCPANLHGQCGHPFCSQDGPCYVRNSKTVEICSFSVTHRPKTVLWHWIH